MVLTIVAFFFVLSVVVLVHELGHFLVAKLNGIFVVTFSFGFGPKLLRKRIGETEYAISVLPFGGYVKFGGETPEDEEKGTDTEVSVAEDRMFRNKSPQRRMLVVLAGPAMNFILALLVYIMSLWIQGVYINPSREVLEVEKGSPAAEAGFLPGDRILFINGERFDYWGELNNLVVFEPGVSSSFTVLRGADTLALDVSPAYDRETGLWELGIRSPLPPKIGTVKKDSPAENAGIKTGAVVLSINDTTVTKYSDLERMIHPSPGEPKSFRWEFEGKIYSEVITPDAVDAPSEGSRLDVIKIGQIGIGPYYERKGISFFEAAELGTRAFTGLLIGIIDFLGKLFTGKATLRAVGGPLRVGIMAGDMIRWGFSYLIYFLAFFSLNLAIFNLLPILPFDGGHFVLYLTEFVSGRRLGQRTQQVMMQVGFIILIILMVFVLSLDILNIFR